LPHPEFIDEEGNRRASNAQHQAENDAVRSQVSSSQAEWDSKYAPKNAAGTSTPKQVGPSHPTTDRRELYNAMNEGGGRELKSSKKLLQEANEHASVLQGHITQLMATHGDHPVVGPHIQRAQRSLVAAQKIMSDSSPARKDGANSMSYGRYANTETMQKARPAVADILKHVLDAHDHLTHSDVTSAGVSAPSVPRVALEQNHAIAEVQARHPKLNFKQRGKAPKIVDWGPVGKVDMTTTHGQNLAAAAREQHEAKTPGVDVNVSGELGAPQGTARVRKRFEKMPVSESTKINRSGAAQQPRRRPAKAARATSSANIDAPKANVETRAFTTKDSKKVKADQDQPTRKPLPQVEDGKTYAPDQIYTQLRMPKENPVAAGRVAERKAKRKPAQTPEIKSALKNIDKKLRGGK
jgi:hypothetical protein